jgi:sugar phosphate permease
MALTVLAAAVFTLAGGRLSDLCDSRIPTLLAFLGVSFAGFILFAIAGTLSTLVLACLLIGAGQGGANGPLIALLADLTPTERTGRAMGTNNVFGDLGGGLGPVVTLPPVRRRRLRADLRGLCGATARRWRRLALGPPCGNRCGRSTLRVDKGRMMILPGV